MRTIVAILLLSLIPQSLDACGRCGHSYCRSCYANKVVKVATPVVYQQPANVFVVQNSYAQPLVGQGATGYSGANYASFQQGQLQFFDRGAYLSQRMELARAMSASLSLDFNQQTVLAERFATLEAPAIERLAAGQAGAMVLQAAGLDVRGQASGQRSAVIVSHDEYGNIQVKPLDERGADAAYQRYEDAQGPPQGEQGPPQGYPQGGEGFPLVTQFCGKCHGEQVAQPEGGFYVGSSPEVAGVMQQEWFKITNHVATLRDMPPEGAPQPSDEQRGQILNELESIISNQGARP